MQPLQMRVSSLIRHLLKKTSPKCSNSILLRPQDSLNPGHAWANLPVRHFGRQRRRASASYDDPSSDAEQLGNGTSISQEDVQHISEPPTGAYRTSTEQLWPTTRHQKKYGARVRDALHTVIMDCGGAAYERLVRQLGFTIVEVRMSPDNMTAFILWDAHDDCLYSAEREVGYRMSQLRRDMGRLLGMRRTPRLELRLDRLSQEQKAVEDALERLRAER